MDFDKTPWLNGFKAAGLSFDKIDYVFGTPPAHRPLRLEHGAARRALGADLSEGEILFDKREYDYWEAATKRGDNPPGQVWNMNCLPIVEAGQALLVDDDYALDDTITLTPTPGHSPCHCCVNIFSKGQRAVVTGDMMHHALQCREPEWSTIFYIDAKQAAASRRGFLVGGRHRHLHPADPFPLADGGADQGRRGPVRLALRQGLSLFVKNTRAKPFCLPRPVPPAGAAIEEMFVIIWWV